VYDSKGDFIGEYNYGERIPANKCQKYTVIVQGQEIGSYNIYKMKKFK